MGTAIKHPAPDRVKQSFVIFDMRALWQQWAKKVQELFKTISEQSELLSSSGNEFQTVGPAS